MRPIRFRGKRMKTEEWSIGYLVSKDEINVNTFGGTSIIGHHVDPATVGQFTGLQDKNGVDIFEGDKWKLEENSGVIRFERGSFMIDCFYSLREFAEHIEITGTIHDIPSEEGAQK